MTLGPISFKSGGRTFTFNRPIREPLDDRSGNPVLSVGGLIGQTACKLFARTGVWPEWFRWMVTDNVPRRFQLEGARLALQVVNGVVEVTRREAVAARPAASVAPRSHRSGLVALPAHVCVGGVKRLNGCGPIDEALVGICTTIRDWKQVRVGGKDVFEPIDHKGCGARFVLDHWGNRVIG